MLGHALPFRTPFLCIFVSSCDNMSIKGELNEYTWGAPCALTQQFSYDRITLQLLTELLPEPGKCICGDVTIEVLQSVCPATSDNQLQTLLRYSLFRARSLKLLVDSF